MMLWSHEGTDCAGCHSPVSIGQHRVIAGSVVWHEACWLAMSADARGVNYLEDCLL